MKTHHAILFLFFAPFTCLWASEEILICNTKEISASMPAHFRTMQDSFVSSHRSHLPSRTGLKNLKISGSGQYPKNGFKKVIQKLKPQKHILFVDLRQESHGFINNHAVSWYKEHDWSNKGKSLKEIQADEQRRLRHALQRKKVKIHVGKHQHTTKVQSVCTEKQLAKELNVSYYRLPVRDNTKPTRANVDAFIRLVKNLPESHWLHLHCMQGMGRTTTFLAMYDMIKNAKKVSFNDIIARQKLLGGMNLMNKPNKHSWNASYVKERSIFLRRFYNYCKAQSPEFRISWSKWNKKKHWSW